jgi:hypothetical protein
MGRYIRAKPEGGACMEENRSQTLNLGMSIDNHPIQVSCMSFNPLHPLNFVSLEVFQSLCFGGDRIPEVLGSGVN